MTKQHKAGFTLIELSIVLVIIGLIVGGVLVGRDLIEAASIRAQVSQIEKYHTAVHTFQTKFNCLPGDCSHAANVGLTPRNGIAGEGDGNGLLESGGCAVIGGVVQSTGETVMFWADLAAANLIGGSFTAALPGGYSDGGYTGGISNFPAYFPSAAIGKNNYIYAFAGGYIASGNIWIPDGFNYYGISGITYIEGCGWLHSYTAMTVQEAYNIDQKVDDGYPQSGGVTARYMTVAAFSYASPGITDGSATPPTATTCYDNGNVAGAVEQYSLSQNGGEGLNCGVSFRFQ